MCPGPMRADAGDAAGAAAMLDDRIGRATAVAANLLREASESRSVEAGSGR
jgi:hypothetical protein